MNMKDAISKAVVRVILTYLLFAGLWMLISHLLLADLVVDPEARSRYSIWNCYALVLATALLLYFHLRHVLKAHEHADDVANEAAEHQLAESEQKYREIVEIANCIILRWNSEGCITFLNDFGLRFFGYAAEEIFGRPLVGTIVPPTESSGRDLRQLMDKIGADPKGYEYNVNENIRRNGERLWIAWNNRIVFDQHGGVAELLSIGTDITERKLADERIRKLNDELRRYADELEERVAARTAELAARNKDLERFNRLFVDRELRMKELKQRIKEQEPQRSAVDESQ